MIGKKSNKPLLAYMVSDGDERAEVVFARSSTTARRLGGNAMGLDFDEVDSCRRAREFDCFAPGPVPKLSLIETGWWFECHGCGRSIKRDADEDDDEGYAAPNEVGCHNAIEDGQAIYCSEICKADSAARDAQAKAVAAAGVATMVHYLMAGTPIARIVRTHGYASPYLGVVKLEQVIVDFSLPGFPSAGEVRYQDHSAHRIGKRSKPHPLIFLNPVSLPAFEAYHHRRQIDEGWHRWDDDGGALHPQSEREWAPA